MQKPTNMTILPNFSKYGITSDGDVWRVDPPKRGRNAGAITKVTPVIHPRGHLWSVHLHRDDGKRMRVPIKKLMESVFGPETIS